MLEFHFRREVAGRRQRLDGTGAFASGSFPQRESAGAESLRDVGFTEGSELAESGDAPQSENVEVLRFGFGGFEWQRIQESVSVGDGINCGFRIGGFEPLG